MLLGVAATVLRIRKLRRDEAHEVSQLVDRRLMSPPPSPYEPSKGFRLLNGPLEPARRPEPPRPRLTSDRDYVFSETQMTVVDDVAPIQLRHSQKWALSRSTRQPTSLLVVRVAAIVLVIVLIVVVGYSLQRGSAKTPALTTTTTTTNATTTTRATTTTSSPATSSSFGSAPLGTATATSRSSVMQPAVVLSVTRRLMWSAYETGL